VHAFDVRPEVSKHSPRKAALRREPPRSAAGRSLIILVVNADQTSDVLSARDGAAGALASARWSSPAARSASEFAIDLGERLHAKGVLMIDAPVSGGRARRQGRISIMLQAQRKRS